jgi:hypothetical protein
LISKRLLDFVDPTHHVPHGVNIAVVVRSKGVLEFYSGRAEHNLEAFWNPSKSLILRVPRGKFRYLEALIL